MVDEFGFAFVNHRRGHVRKPVSQVEVGCVALGQGGVNGVVAVAKDEHVRRRRIQSSNTDMACWTKCSSSSLPMGCSPWARLRLDQPRASFTPQSG